MSVLAELWSIACWSDLQGSLSPRAEGHLLLSCLQLKVGNAEVFGTELPLGEMLALQGQKIAVSCTQPLALQSICFGVTQHATVSQQAVLQLHVLHVCSNFSSRAVHCQLGMSQLSVLCPLLQSAHTLAHFLHRSHGWDVPADLYLGRLHRPAEYP